MPPSPDCAAVVACNCAAPSRLPSGGSLPLIVVLMQSVGVPGEGIGIIMGIDRLLDMCRTVLNVTGDLVVATCVAGGAADQAK